MRSPPIEYGAEALNAAEGTEATPVAAQSLTAATDAAKDAVKHAAKHAAKDTATAPTPILAHAPTPPYRGRFAPSPTGPLHQGSLISALASYLDARAHDGEWLIRIEDVDAPRTVAGAADDILETLDAYGMRTTQSVVWQSQRGQAYEDAFDCLNSAGLLYPCGCTRKEIAEALARQQQAHTRNATLAYPGTCRDGLHGGVARAWRLRVPDAQQCETFVDRWQGEQKQDLGAEVGDFALRRADGLWAYQLAVVVDDAHSGITHIVRGADLLDSTPRQIYLQRCLGLPTPRYLHVPLLTDATGEKLSKQNGATALPRSPEGILAALHAAATFLGLRVAATDRPGFYDSALQQWRNKAGVAA